jgi:glycosyltransferase involved in cell wall biosynthesis
MRICMFVKNSFEYDARVTKEAKTLVDAGHEVIVVALFAPKTTEQREITADGIRVIRVPRTGLGVPTLNRLAGKASAKVEIRHAKLTGDPIDVEKIRELGRITAPSTALPGEEESYPLPEITPLARPPDDAAKPQKYANWAGRYSRRMYAKLTTRTLRRTLWLARRLVLILKRLLGTQSQQVKHRAIDSRMIDVGVALEADVYHCHDLNTFAVGVECKRKVPGSRLVYDSHELQTERNRMSGEARRKAVAEEGRCFREADAFIVASPSWIAWDRELYGSIPDASITLLNVPELEQVERTRALHEEIGIPPEAKILVYQGSIQENRGIEPAIEAVRDLDDVVLVIIGYGHHRPELEAYVERENLTDRVKFFGPIPNDELLRYTAAADIGLCNIVNSSMSYYTSLPNKLFEYAMAGLAVIGSDSPEIGRIVGEEEIGEVTDPEDPQGIAAAVRTILADTDRYRPGLEHATARYNWTVEGEKLVALYEQL